MRLRIERTRHSHSQSRHGAVTEGGRRLIPRLLGSFASLPIHLTSTLTPTLPLYHRRQHQARYLIEPAISITSIARPWPVDHTHALRPLQAPPHPSDRWRVPG
jgi:hypothetical protein